jgi:phosphate transport system substrate-binding protein
MQLRGRKQVITAGGAVFAVALLAACSSNSNPPSPATSAPAAGGATSAAATGGSTAGTSASGTINASGSTFQTNFQQEAIAAFKSVDPSITVNYGGGGSGKGRTDLASGTVLFAGSDSPIPASEKANFKGQTVLYFPVQIGPIAIAYNLPGVSNLQLDAPTLAGIFQGTIKTWNDSAIKALNPSANLPSTPIAPVVRSDSSGTTQNFSLFLMDATSTWKLGSSSTIKWPGTVHAAAGNSGVAQGVKSTTGGIGYVDDSTAKASSLTVASIKNKDGQYVAPTTAGATAAAAGIAPASDLTFHAVWATGAAAYPITYQSWDLVYAKQSSANNAALLKAYLGFLLSSQGQALLAPIGLAPLPTSIDQAAVSQLSQITS